MAIWDPECSMKRNLEIVEMDSIVSHAMLRTPMSSHYESTESSTAQGWGFHSYIHRYLCKVLIWRSCMSFSLSHHQVEAEFSLARRGTRKRPRCNLISSQYPHQTS